MNTSSPEKLKITTSIALFFFLVLGVYLRWKCLDEVFVNVWIARDFDRAFNIFDGVYFPLAGPELNNGGRLPGPFMYIFLSLPLLFHYSYESIFVFNFVWNICALGLLFWVLRRFFGFYISTLCTILFCLNLSHIGIVTFPFNPAYIFPFTILFLWFLLELTVTRKTIYLAGLGVVICLRIQLHYSIITYVLPIIFTLVFFKIRINAKDLAISILLISICLLPYGIYKKQSYVPNNAGESLTFEERKPLSLIRVARVIGVQNTIDRISEARSFFYGKDHSDNFRKINWFVLSFCFYFMVLTTAIRAKKIGIESCKKEITVLAAFYFPCLIYEISQPHDNHFWYIYIFIVSQILIVVLTVATIYKLFKNLSVKAVVSTVFLSYLIYFSYHTVDFVQSFLSAQPKDFTQHTYKKSKVLLKTLMERLNLTPQQFYERVYLRDFNPNSFKRIQLASLDKNENANKKVNNIRESCFFVIDSLDKGFLGKQILTLFINDRDITIKKAYEILVETGSSSRKLIAYEYKPNFRQACYRNLSNPFLTEKSLRDLFVDAKKLIKRPRKDGTTQHPVLKSETLNLKEEYDSDSKLINFQGHYVFFNNHTRLPFRLQLNIKKKSGKYFLRGDIENYYFWEGPNYRMRRLFVVIRNKKNPNQSAISSILSQDKLINSFQNSNLKWFREVELDNNIEWTKGQFKIVVAWEINWHEQNYDCCSAYETNNFVLKS